MQLSIDNGGRTTAKPTAQSPGAASQQRPKRRRLLSCRVNLRGTLLCLAHAPCQQRKQPRIDATASNLCCLHRLGRRRRHQYKFCNAPRRQRRGAHRAGRLHCTHHRETLMFFPEGQVRVFLYSEPATMRLSFDGLYVLTRHRMHQDPPSGNL